MRHSVSELIRRLLATRYGEDGVYPHGELSVIARDLGVNPTLVFRAAAALGYVGGRSRAYMKAIGLWESGLSIREVAERLGVSKSAVQEHLKQRSARYRDSLVHRGAA